MLKPGRILFALYVWALLGGALSALAHAQSSQQRLIELEQGWSQADRELWWNSPQGSRILPYAWFLQLETAAGGSKFAANEALAGYGFIPSPISTINPDGLPIGFAREPGRDGGPPWLGMTCAACHVGTITYRGQTALIEGAGSMADIARFDRDLSAALTAAAMDDIRFGRFADRLETPSSTRAALRSELIAVAQARNTFTKINTPPHDPGPGRVDALGIITNAVTAIALNQPDNARPPNAPVRMPRVWNSPNFSRFLYNGSIVNVGLGPVMRDLGQTLGVYGTVDVSQFERSGYANSVSITDRDALDGLMRRLQPPAWPAFLPPIDRALADQGRPLFAAHCAGCHQPRARNTREVSLVKMVSLDEIGTDPLAARNFMTRTAVTGVLEGRPVGFFGGEAFGPRAGATTIVGHVGTGVAAALIPRERLIPLLASFRQAMGDAGGTDGYKAVPLSGVWATAPYLHNGSVANLQQLLTPAAQRARQFSTAGQQYDPVVVGYPVDSTASWGYVFDTSLPGNSAGGHEYGTDLPSDDRKRLLEFLKTL